MKDIVSNGYTIFIHNESPINIVHTIGLYYSHNIPDILFLGILQKNFLGIF